MDTQNSHFNFGGGAGSSFLPVSAFSAYSLLRRCNYFLTPETSEFYNKTHIPRISPELLQPNEETENPTLSAPKTLITPTPVFGYPHHLHILQNDHLGSGTRPDVISPGSGVYSTNCRRQRGEKKPIPDDQKDEKYFERRKRNNQAAKKSRDARKMREDQIALRATILEHENAILRAQVLTLREETSSLRQMLLQKKTLEISARDSQICAS